MIRKEVWQKEKLTGRVFWHALSVSENADAVKRNEQERTDE